MKRKGRHVLRQAVPLLLLTLILGTAAGCGGETATEPDNSKSRVVVAQGADVTTMDPHNQSEGTTANVLRHIYEALLTRDQDMKLQPLLAEEWSVVDERTIRIRLRQGITFSNGEPFNAQVAKFNFDRVTGALEGQSTVQDFLYENIASVEVVDEYAIDINLKKPDALAINDIGGLMIIPKTYVEEKGFDALDTNPVGTGPYLLDQWNPQDSVVLKARQDYWRDPAAIDEVVFRPLPEAATRLAELKTGGVDIITNLPPSNIAELEGSDRVEVRTVPSSRIPFLFFNTLDYDLFDDVRVRKAFNLAIDKEAIINSLYMGYGTQVSTLAPPYFAGYDPNDPFYGYDPEEARRLLEEAGFDFDHEIEILSTRGRFLNDAQLTEAIASYLGDVGVKVKVNAVEFGVFARQTQERDIPEMMLAALGNSSFDTQHTLRYIVISGTDAFSWYANPAVDALYDEARVAMDPDEHRRLLREANDILFADPAFVYLFALEDVYGVSKRIDWQPRSDEQIHLYGTEFTR